MKKNIDNLIILNNIFVSCLIISNILSAKIISLLGLTVPAAIVAYPITFLITDIVGEIWGVKEANNIVKNGFICQIVSLILIAFAIILPVSQFSNNQYEFSLILGQSFRTVFASMVAYLVSQRWDVYLFHKIRNWFISSGYNTNKTKWIWNNVGTMTSQAIDTVIFITIAFYGTVPNVAPMIIGQYIVKFILACLDTPFFYFFTRNNAINKES